MPKARAKRLSPADRRTLLAEAKAKGWTADQVAKKAGVSKWTVYGWRKSKTAAAGGKRTAKKAGARRGRPRASASGSGNSLRSMIAQIVREELGRLVSGK